MTQDLHRKCTVCDTVIRCHWLSHTIHPPIHAPSPAHVSSAQSLEQGPSSSVSCSSQSASCLAWTVVPPTLPFPANSYCCCLSFKNKSDSLARDHGRADLSRSGHSLVSHLHPPSCSCSLLPPTPPTHRLSNTLSTPVYIARPVARGTVSLLCPLDKFSFIH